MPVVVDLHSRLERVSTSDGRSHREGGRHPLPTLVVMCSTTTAAPYFQAPTDCDPNHPSEASAPREIPPDGRRSFRGNYRIAPSPLERSHKPKLPIAIPRGRQWQQIMYYVTCRLWRVTVVQHLTCESLLINTCCPCKSAAKSIAGALSPVTQVIRHPRTIPVACSKLLSLTGFSNIRLLSFGAVARDQEASTRCRLGLGSANPASDKLPSTAEHEGQSWLSEHNPPSQGGEKNEAIIPPEDMIY